MVGQEERATHAHARNHTRSKQDVEEAREELAETADKFQIGLGESRFYHGLAKQAQNLTPEGVGGSVEEMEAGLVAMQQKMGPDSPFVMAALRCVGQVAGGRDTSWRVGALAVGIV